MSRITTLFHPFTQQKRTSTFSLLLFFFIDDFIASPFKRDTEQVQLWLDKSKCSALLSRNPCSFQWDEHCPFQNYVKLKNWYSAAQKAVQTTNDWPRFLTPSKVEWSLSSTSLILMYFEKEWSKKAKASRRGPLCHTLPCKCSLKGALFQKTLMHGTYIQIK